MGLDNIIGLENGSKNWESIFVVQLSIIVVAINSRNFNFLSRFGPVNEVPEKDNLTMTRKTACRNGSRRFLKSEFLVIAVHGLLRVEIERSTRLAVLAVGDLDFHVRLLLERSESSPALVAVEHNIFQLWENPASSSDD